MWTMPLKYKPKSMTKRELYETWDSSEEFWAGLNQRTTQQISKKTEMNTKSIYAPSCLPDTEWKVQLQPLR